jgi:hypothetical protein
MTKPTHPVELLACAIATQEGWWDGDSAIPVQRKNPGDLHYVGQEGGAYPPKGSPDPLIAVFVSVPAGITALFRQIWLQVAEGQTVRTLIDLWSDGDAVYLANVLEWTGLPADTPVLELLPALVKLNG